MTDYRAPVRDFLFTLRHIGRIEELAKSERFGHADLESVSAVLEEQGRLMNEVWAPTNRDGDTEGLRWSPDGVTTPDSFKPAWSRFVEGGWQGLNAGVDYGGAGFPESVFVGALEFMSSANGALTMCPGLTIGAIGAIETWGSEEQKETYLPNLVSAHWTATMNLTEPQAGSDVGLVNTKAIPQDDGTFRITGQKIFISWGEHDLAENIIHLVLARTPGAPAGTKGISLFIVPKFLVNDDGSLGERNDVRCVSIEHKMGIHASPTCSMSYGDADGAIGFLVGEENHGMRAMFTMMNAARIAVGVQGVAMSESSYQKALAYAVERKQGAEVGGATREPAAIVVHPDVRRMLLTMRSHIDATRALIVFNAAALDFAKVTEGAESEQWREIADLLTPVSKGWTTDVGVEMTSLGIQIFGGMGYIEEAGVSQHFRDMRIAPIYEGTNGIQAMDLVARKLPMRGGGVVTDFLQRMRDIDSDLAAAGDEFDVIRTNLAAQVQTLTHVTNWILEHGLADPKESLSGASPYLRIFGIVVGGYLHAQLALSARSEIELGAADADWLQAKISSARFYAAEILPQAAGHVSSVTAGAGYLFETAAEHLASA